MPVLTLIIGYLLAIRGTTKRIAAEKRAEYVSRFIGQAYQNLRYLFSSKSAAEAGNAVPEFAVLGQQAAFFLSDEAATAIEKLTSCFTSAWMHKIDPDPDERRDAWKEYKTELDLLRASLRRELQAAPGFASRWGLE